VNSVPRRQEKRAASVAVLIRSPLWRVTGLRPVETARKAARAALGAAETAYSPEVAVALSDDAELRELNRIWRGKDRPTNVLAFPTVSGPAGPRLPIGDVILAFETVAQEAEAVDLALSDHLSHLVVHGVLHLLGYDHEKPAEARRMEELEVRVLAGLGIADPYAALPPLRRLDKR
jgi:probable rRNA maturation factor